MDQGVYIIFKIKNKISKLVRKEKLLFLNNKPLNLLFKNCKMIRKKMMIILVF